MIIRLGAVLVASCLGLLPDAIAAGPFDPVLVSPHNFLPRSDVPSGANRVCGACHAPGPMDGVVGAQVVPPPSGLAESAAEASPGAPPLWAQDAQAFSTQTTARSGGGPAEASAKCLGCHDGVLGAEVHRVGTFHERRLDHPYGRPYPRGANGRFRPANPTPNQFRYWSIPDLTDEGFVLPTGPVSDRLNLKPGTAPTDLAALQTVRTSDGNVQCDSCHNPHDNQHAPFLRAPASDLCLICHDR